MTDDTASDTRAAPSIASPPNNEPERNAVSLEIDFAKDELALVEALAAGDEAAFATLVDRYHNSMVRVARMFVADLETAEEVVQESWLGVLNGIGSFQGRSALKTWIFRIVSNRAKTRGQRERRVATFSSLGWAETDEPAEDPTRFLTGDEPFAGGWAAPPDGWLSMEDRLLLEEARVVVKQAIEQLPERQRIVITLRDVDGWSADEVRNELEVSQTNQRVLLHRARVKVRQALEAYLELQEGVAP